MNLLKFLMLLALVVWVGGIIFFTAATAPTVLAAPVDRPTGRILIHEALVKLHWMGLASGVTFLIASLIYSRATRGFARPFSIANIAAVVMLACAAISQFKIMPEIATLRGTTDAASVAQFAHLHSVSVALEMTTLVLGLILIYLTARRLS